MNPGSMPSGGGNTPNIGGGTSGMGGMTPSTGGGANGGGFDAKSQAISQADNMLGKYVSNTPDVGEKVGLSKKEAKEEAKEAEENGEPQAEPSAPTPGEKLGDGKQVNDKGEVEKTATRKLVGAAGTAVATYYGGAKGAELASQIDNSKTGGAVLGKVSDELDKIPGVEQASKDLEGASEAVSGAAGAYAAAKNGNYAEAFKKAREAKKGLAKQKKTLLKKYLISMAISCAPFILIVVFIIIICGPSIGGFNENTKGYDAQMTGTGADPGTGEPGTDPGQGGQDPSAVVVGEADNATLQKIIDIAMGELNTLEGSVGWEKYGQSGAWCAAFASYVLQAAGVTSIPTSHSCNSWKNALIKANKWGSAGSYTPKVGDIVFYDWKGDGVADHVGIVTSVNGNTIHTIEGNTKDPSGSTTTDGVFAKTRNTNSVIGYGVV